jgi:hypothetical protein
MSVKIEIKNIPEGLRGKVKTELFFITENPAFQGGMKKLK